MGNRHGIHLAILTALLLIPATAGALPTVNGTLTLSPDLEIDGTVNATLADGAIHLNDGETRLQSGSLEAENLTVEYAYKRAIRSDFQSGPPLYQDNYDWGQDTIHADEIHGNLTAFGTAPEALAMVEPSSADVRASGVGPIQAQTVQDAFLTRVGNSDDFTTTDDEARQGFWYYIDGPWTATTGFDGVRIQGTFSVFVNNLTLNVDDSDQGNWSHWTGTKTEPGPTPGTQQVETRITLLHIHNGTLWLSATDALDLYAPHQETSVDGRVTASRAQGSLQSDAQRLLYTPAPLIMEGQGRLALTPQPGGGTPGGPETPPPTPTPALNVNIKGTFDVEHRPGVQVEHMRPASTWTNTLTTWTPWLALLLIAGASGYIYRDRAMAWYTHHKSDKRRDRQERWRRAGDMAFEAREYEEALPWYQRIVDAYPNSIDGWNSLAATLEELNRYGEAADAYETTADLMKQDTHMLGRAAGCAWKDGQKDRAVDIAIFVAENDPRTLHRLLSKPDLQGLREHPRLRKALKGEPSGTDTSYV